MLFNVMLVVRSGENQIKKEERGVSEERKRL